MTYAELWGRLTGLYGEGEAKAIARMVFEVRYGLTLSDLLMGRDAEVPQDEVERLAQRLEQGEPVQYVLGQAEFGGRWFTVTPDVLIPRPETYELCEWSLTPSPLQKERESLHLQPSAFSPQPSSKILDIGTGSGCIGITLALALPKAEVTAWDISEKALAVARENARRLGADVTFEQVDILSPLNSFSLIVSNPPYICEKEKALMERNVLDHEPELALFVPDDDALLFYRAIARFAREALLPKGLLYFEINPTYRDELVAMLAGMGFTEIEVKADQFGKQRMLKAQQP